MADWDGAAARLKFLFGPTPRDYAISGAMVIFLLGGPSLMLVGIQHYPLLDERALWAAAALYAIAFPVSFSIIKKRMFPPLTPKWARAAARAGFAICFVMWVFGAVLVSNGFATPVQTRSVAVVRKETSRERDPNRRQYRLYVLAWPASNEVTQVDSTAEVYNRVRVGDRVILTLGNGRLGMQWVQAVQLR